MKKIFQKIKTKKLIITLVAAIAIISAAAGPLDYAAAEGGAVGENQTGGLGDELSQQSEAFIAETGLGKPSLNFVISQIIKTALSFLGLIFVILIIYAGFLWLTSAGNEDKISKAKKIMVASVIGLAIVLSAYAITIFVLEKLLRATVEQRSIYFAR